VGRPSKAAERKTAILLATASVVARDGLAETTVGKVADEAHIQRTLVLHYFRDRQSLIEAFVNQVVAFYGDLQIVGGAVEPIERQIDRAFDDGFYARDEDLVVWSELVALAARDASIRERLCSLWEDRWLPMIREELRKAFPTASSSSVRQGAYGLACLVEAHWSFRLQGLDNPERRRQAKANARLLLDHLRNASPRRSARASK
jgi:AcrR family transcriptional regulator